MQIKNRPFNSIHRTTRWTPRVSVSAETFQSEGKSKQRNINEYSTKWGFEQEEAFKALKEAFTHTPVLQHPNDDQPYIIETDASKYATGAVILQLDKDKQEKPVAFLSKKLTPTETR